MEQVACPWGCGGSITIQGEDERGFFGICDTCLRDVWLNKSEESQAYLPMRRVMFLIAGVLALLPAGQITPAFSQPDAQGLIYTIQTVFSARVEAVEEDRKSVV